ncbi:MAG: hypothetical protein GY778_04485, partial [bacterium]|nr:hypothetical protein [bacterium]
INTYNKLVGRGNSGGDLIVAYDPSRTDLADYVVPSSLMVSVRPIQVGATVTQVTYAGFTGGARSEYPVEAFTIGVPLGS